SRSVQQNPSMGVFDAQDVTGLFPGEAFDVPQNEDFPLRRRELVHGLLELLAQFLTEVGLLRGIWPLRRRGCPVSAPYGFIGLKAVGTDRWALEDGALRSVFACAHSRNVEADSNEIGAKGGPSFVPVQSA